MNTINQMKNMIVLKNLPSNIIEEAFVVLKPNKKVKVTKQKNMEKEKETIEERTNEYIVKEAEIVINDYLEDEENLLERKETIEYITYKYRRLRLLTLFIMLMLIVSIVLGIIY